ncbi:hypothetical protein [Acetivibrio mesophilus]|uniref:Uncharacterized protein n=1 Tax=Acetivibrio mesophilus TaxID=2487273 RepID=A0A4Q0I344_9FIRM|nr:hypothetical protein [Acetivibrio mesophilus]ODM24835.1 hypothetical protein A7W90_00645 [Clostridium sp. Bc-iso-3]RXE58670.1 hypothetical protein EFD62_10890 [Acetivibrio mesophilus]HHV27998.1 hypothetical protein [Clostridium sp.]
MKKVIIVVLVVLLTIGGGLIVPIMINRDVSRANGRPDNTTYTPAGTEEPLSTPKGDTTPEVALGSSPTPTDYILPEDLEDTGTEYQENTQPSGSAGLVKGSQAWIDKKIEEHRDEILDDDLADFRRIFPKIDIGYVQSLGSGGYTDEDMEQLKAYLYRTIGGADYERAKILFYRYSYILEED